MKEKLRVQALQFSPRENVEVSQRLRPRVHHFGRAHFYILREPVTAAGANTFLYQMYRADAIPTDPVTPWLEAEYMNLIIDARALEIHEDPQPGEIHCPNPGHYANREDYERALNEYNEKTNHGQF